MLTLRAEQIDSFRQSSLSSFDKEMLSHGKRFSPQLTEVLGDAQLQVVVRNALERAHKHGFQKRGPLRLFLEMTFLFGSSFDNDPQYPWTAKILRSPGDEMRRAELLHRTSLDYFENVAGPEATYTQKAKEQLRLLAQSNREKLDEEMDVEIGRIFPEKLAYVGRPGILALVQEAREEAAKLGFPLRGEVLLVALMLAFGHGCLQDPLYPWISRTLQDPMIMGPSARSARLERKALTWLDHVGATEQGEGQHDPQ